MPKYFGSDLPPISQLETRTKLALINANPIIENLGPLLPNVIPVGGLHIKKANPLPKVISLSSTKKNNQKNYIKFFLHRIWKHF